MSEAVTERLIEANPCTVRGAAGKPSPIHRAEALSMPELRAYYEALDRDRRPHRFPDHDVFENGTGRVAHAAIMSKPCRRGPDRTL